MQRVPSCSRGICLGLALCAAGFAQIVVGSLVGNVTDSTGAAVPGAAVQAKNVETGQVRNAVTNSDGSYSFPALPSGTYTVSVQAKGFKVFQASGVAVSVDKSSRVNATLELGSESQEVTVSAETAALQTENAQVSHNITNDELQNIPTSVDRNYESLLSLVPGITPLSVGGSYAANPSRAVTFSSNGATQQNNNVRIDGAPATNVWMAMNTAYTPSLDAIQQVSAVTNAMDVSQGIAGGAAVNVVMKSGTNALHGSAYEYNINNHFTARPEQYYGVTNAAGQILSTGFAPTPGLSDKNIINDFGATVGGPIVRDKLFYFVSYEGRFTREFASRTLTVPTEAMRAGNLAGGPQLYNPFTGNPDGTGRQPFAGNQIPASLISPIALKIQSYIPLPNAPGISNNFLAGGDFSNDRHTIDAKVDWQTTSKLRISPRIGILDTDTYNPPAYGTNGLPVSSTGGRAAHMFGKVINSTTTYSYVLAPSLVLDGYFGFTQEPTSAEPYNLGKDWGSDVFGIPGTNGQGVLYSGWPEFDVTGQSNWGNSGSNGGPIYYRDNNEQIATNATWIKGRHNVRFGAQISRLSWNHFEASAPVGQFSFGTGPTSANIAGYKPVSQYNGYGTFLLGLATGASKDILPFDNSRIVAHEWQYSLYVQDQWHVLPTLSLTAGLGWNYFPMGQRNGRGMERYDLATNTIELCGVASVPSNCGYDMDKKAFSPNLGMAWQFRPTWVLRIGGGINYDPEPLAFVRDLLSNYPEDQAFSVSVPNSYVWGTTLQQGLPAFTPVDISKGVIPLPQGFSTQTLPGYVKRDYVESWNATLQKNFLRSWFVQAGYVATRSVDIPQFVDINLPSTLGGGAKSDPYYARNGSAALNVEEAVNHIDYDSLQASLRRTLSHGLAINVAYTFSKALGICCNTLADKNAEIQIPQYLYLARSLEPYDRTHNLQFAWVAALPFGPGKPLLTHGIAAAIAGGWQLNGQMSLYSGTPFSISASGTSLNTPGITQRADLVGPVTTNGFFGPGNPAFFNTSAFTDPVGVAIGTAGYNLLRGPGVFNVNASLFRSFRLTERLKLDFRAEALNLTNGLHYNNPNGSVDSTSFGIISSVSDLGNEGLAQRVFRLGAHISF